MRLGKLIKYSGIGIAAAARSALTGRRAREYLVTSLLDQPGLPAKVAQIIAMRSSMDTTPRPAARMTMEEVRQRIEADAPALAREIDRISEDARVASLSQVHEAKLKSGEHVAIKVQFPGLADEIARQVDDFVDLAARSPARAYGFTRESWGQFLKEKLLEEINYRAEARYQDEFRAKVRAPWLVVPRVFEAYSSTGVLTQSFEPSTSPEELRGLRDVIGHKHIRDAAKMMPEIMAEMLARAIFQANLIHCDLNPGNYGFRIDAESGSTSLVLYDFGAMLRLNDDQVKIIARMIARACGEIDDDWMALLGNAGFDTVKLEPLSGRLHQLMPALLEPFRARGKFDPASWHPGRITDEIAGSDKWWLRTAGPPWFLYLMRTVQGWHHGLKLIGEPVDSRRIFEGFMAPALASSMPARRHENTGPQTPATSDSWNSRHLRVRVQEGAVTLVDLEMPAIAVGNLADLVPGDVAVRIEAQGLDLRKMATELTAARAPRGVVFEATLGARHYRVWLD
ncbi:hypothetical protein EBZ80_01010 [bacterium]|nr:hypothetical protein [bacterium]